MDFACLDLLNSEWHDYRGSGRTEDRLENPRWLGEFLARWRLEVAAPPGPDARTALAALRSLLRRMVEALHSGSFPAAADLVKLNAVLTAAPAVRHVASIDGGYRVELVPVERNWDWVLAEVAASFAELLAHHDPHRVKVCENPDCRWVFYDESRNRTRRWCESAGCGNLLKVRRFRARQQKASRKTGRTS